MRVFPAEEYFFFYPCKVNQTEDIVSVNGSLEKKTNKNPDLFLLSTREETLHVSVALFRNSHLAKPCSQLCMADPLFVCVCFSRANHSFSPPPPPALMFTKEFYPFEV